MRQGCEFEIQFIARRKDVARVRCLAVSDALAGETHNFDLPALQQPLHEVCVLKEGTEQVYRYLSGTVAQGDAAIRQEDDLTFGRYQLAGMLLAAQSVGRYVKRDRGRRGAGATNGFQLQFLHSPVLSQLAPDFQ